MLYDASQGNSFFFSARNHQRRMLLLAAIFISFSYAPYCISLIHHVSLTQVHDALQKQATWNPHLKNLAWRIDVKTSSKDVVHFYS